MQVPAEANVAELVDRLVEDQLPGRRGVDAWTTLLRAQATLIRRLDTDLEQETGLELADDLRRYRNNRPIRARRTPLWERGAKWVRRHPTAATRIYRPGGMGHEWSECTPPRILPPAGLQRPGFVHRTV